MRFRNAALAGASSFNSGGAQRAQQGALRPAQRRRQARQRTQQLPQLEQHCSGDTGQRAGLGLGSTPCGSQVAAAGFGAGSGALLK